MNNTIENQLLNASTASIGEGKMTVMILDVVFILLMILGFFWGFSDSLKNGLANITLMLLAIPTIYFIYPYCANFLHSYQPNANKFLGGILAIFIVTITFRIVLTRIKINAKGFQFALSITVCFTLMWLFGNAVNYLDKKGYISNHKKGSISYDLCKTFSDEDFIEAKGLGKDYKNYSKAQLKKAK